METETRKLLRFQVLAALAAGFIWFWTAAPVYQCIGQVSIAVLGLALIALWATNDRRKKENMILTMEARREDVRRENLRLAKTRRRAPELRNWFRWIQKQTVRQPEEPIEEPPGPPRIIH